MKKKMIKNAIKSDNSSMSIFDSPDRGRWNFPSSLLSWCRRQLKKPVPWFVSLFLIIFLFSFSVRSLIDSTLDRIDSARIVHHDSTRIDSGVRSVVKDKIALIYKDENGELKRVLADEKAYSEFVRSLVNTLEDARREQKNEVTEAFKRDSAVVFKNLHDNIKDFADWYFSYPTTYKIFGVALASAAQHIAEPGSMSLIDYVTLDIQKYFQKHFEKMVLKPEITDPMLRKIYAKTLIDAQERYLTVMAGLQDDFQQFVINNTIAMDSMNQNLIKSQIDWDSQFNKVSMAGYEKGFGGVLTGSLCVVGGAIAGKVLGGTMGKVAAGKLFSTEIGRTFVTKAVSPLIAKVTPMITSVATGTAAGGPMGAIAGIGVGIAIDYAINKGVEWKQRDKFESNAHEAVESFHMEYNDAAVSSLQGAVDVWFEDTINLVPKYDMEHN